MTNFHFPTDRSFYVWRLEGRHALPWLAADSQQPDAKTGIGRTPTAALLDVCDPACEGVATVPAIGYYKVLFQGEKCPILVTTHDGWFRYTNNLDEVIK